MDIENKPAWQDRCLAVTRGTQFGAILLAAMGRKTEYVPRFVGRAYLTSDGFLMCDFVDREGRYHTGAFVGSKEDLDANAEGLARHLGLSAQDYAALTATIAAWVRS
jgi:hypothetical protein